MKVDYSKAKIYKITNDFNAEIYVGSTCDSLVKRFNGHKSFMNFKPGRRIYKLMNEIGFERFRIELIEIFPCEDKYQLRQKEGQYIRELGTLNEMIAGRNTTEYYLDTKEERLEYAKTYRQSNEKKEHIKEVLKTYRENNLEKLNEYSKSYRTENNDVISEKRKEKIKCVCGCYITYLDIKLHKSILI